jgi:hypothetical protein
MIKRQAYRNIIIHFIPYDLSAYKTLNNAVSKKEIMYVCLTPFLSVEELFLFPRGRRGRVEEVFERRDYAEQEVV